MMRMVACRWSMAALAILAWCGMPIPGAVTPQTISVLTWNTEHYAFERRPPKTQHELERNMFDLIRMADPDIILIQETYGSFDRFKAAFPNHHAVLQSACNSVFSKFPIGETRLHWTDKEARVPPIFNTPMLALTDIYAGGLHLRVSSFAMFWLPLCVRTPADCMPEDLLRREASPQSYPLTPRPKAIREALASIRPALAESARIPLIVGGDFNSLSHLDWTSANGRAEGHCGRVVSWPVSRAMADAGFTDAYRKVYSNEVRYPGATCPIAGSDTLSSAPWVRIDYVYSAGGTLKPIAAEVIQGRYHRPFVWRGRKFSMFPSDHAALLVRFAIQKDAAE